MQRGRCDRPNSPHRWSLSNADVGKTGRMKPEIETTTDGPFIIRGVPSLRSMSMITSEKGEPMTWDPGGRTELESDSALCRCGASNNKPFCDGSHQSVEWESADGFSASSTTAERAESLGGDRLTVRDDKMLCMHAGFCGTERTSIWEMVEESEDTEVRAMTIRMVEKCPSGRLTNVIDGAVVEPSLPVEIGVVPDGPLWVTGNIGITNAAGEAMETRNRVTLCRCGASSLKPLCDGSHAEVGFSHSMDSTTGE